MIEDGQITPQRIPVDAYLELVRLLTTVPQAEPKAWTVLLARPDYMADDPLDTYMTCIEAETAERAVYLAQGEAIVQDVASDKSSRFARLREFAEYNERDDYAVLCVVEGKHWDVAP